MNAQFQAKLLQYLSQKKQKNNQGFTLIELLVVVVIVGILSAVALPNLVGQIGKAREVEGKNGIGTINRAQEAYHYEARSFANGVNEASSNNELGVVVVSRLYDFTITGGADNGKVHSSQPSGIDANKEGIRNFGGGIAYSDAKYTTVVCQTNAKGDDASTIVSTTNGVGCSGSATKLQ